MPQKLKEKGVSPQRFADYLFRYVMLDDSPKQSGIVNLLSIPQAIVGGIFPLDGSPHELAAVIGLL